MAWLNNIFSTLTGNKKDIESIRAKINASGASTILSDDDLSAYIDDIETRSKKMVKDLKITYGKYGVQFAGFKSMESACTSLRTSLKNAKELAYNNLIKLESSITAEQKRHLALIRMAMSSEGKRVIDLINKDPRAKEVFVGVFGERDVSGQENVDGSYNQLWSEIHKLSEYILLQKNKVYH